MVDHSNDAWYIYYHNGANNLTQVKGPWSWSQMLGSTGAAAPSAVNTRKQIASSDWEEHNNITAPGLYQNFHGGQLGYTATGGVRYRDTNNKMYTLDATGSLKYSYTSDPKFGNAGGSASYLWRHYGHPTRYRQISPDGPHSEPKAYDSTKLLLKKRKQK